MSQESTPEIVKPPVPVPAQPTIGADWGTVNPATVQAMAQQYELKQRYASTTSRVLAYLIDIIIVAAVTGMADRIFNAINMTGWFAALVGWLFGVLYFVYQEGTTGQTLGKKVTKIRVTTEDGGQPSYVQAAIRYFLLFIDNFLLLGLWLVIFSDTKQRVGDRAGNTIVVKA